MVMGERHRVRMGLVEEGLWLFWKGAPSWDAGPCPSWTALLPAASRDRVPTCARPHSAGPESWTVVRVIMIIIIILMRTMTSTF